MKITSKTETLSIDQKRLIVDTKKYLKQLDLKKHVQLRFESMPAVHESKVNEFFPLSKCICLNLDFFKGMHPTYARLVAYHEIFHFGKHGLLNHHAVIDIRDHKQWEFVQLCDVEADTEVAIYLHDNGTLSSFSDYLAALHSGSSTFRDSAFRQVKLERFMGSLMSVKLAMETGRKIVFLPTLRIDGMILWSVDYSSSIRWAFCQINSWDVKQWKRIHMHPGNLSQKRYVTLLNHLTSRLLAIVKTDN